MTALKRQEEIDQKNTEYWDTLCGSGLAAQLGIKDFSLASLQKFDAYYLAFYPYLLKHVPLVDFWGKKVLEVGLGYGTLAQLLAASSDYTGLDIAQGPVDVVNARIQHMGLSGRAMQGSILEPAFAPESFDVVVSIGCLHHTGDLPESIRQIERLLKPGGVAYFMVYGAYSYRRWASHFMPTLRQFIAEFLFIGRRREATEKERSAYDQSAPETVFTSARELRKMLRGFASVRLEKENADQDIFLLKPFSRAWLLRWVAPFFGLEFYVKAKKR